MSSVAATAAFYAEDRNGIVELCGKNLPYHIGKLPVFAVGICRSISNGL